MCSQDDLDLVRADGDGMYAREPHHPTMTDPPRRADDIIAGREPSAALTIAATGTASQDEADSGVEEDARHNATKPVVAQAGGAIPAGAMVQIGADGRLERYGSRRAQEHYADVLTAARWKNTLEAIAKRAEAGLPMSTSALRDVINLANAALEIPPLGTRVRCLLPHRGEFGTIVSWDHDLGVPHARWDSDGTIEAVESHEYTTDLNEVD